MKAVIEFLNHLEEEGIIKDYALAGGMAFLFYSETLPTWDVDLFILLAGDTGGFIDLSPLYRAAEKQGYNTKEKEHIMIGAIPVQFLPVDSGLEMEAVENAEKQDYEGSQIKVASLEHLLAIALKVNRSKDRERIIKMLDDKVKINNNKLDQILVKYNLKKEWEKIVDKTK